MGAESSIRLPKTLRDRLNVHVAQEVQRTGKRFTQADWIEKQLNSEDEKQ